VALDNATSGRAVKITNTGTATFGVSGATLSPGTSCTAYVSFEPLGIGARSAKITIAHNASGGPVVVSLSGTGVRSGGYIP
jgi:hypothetical protein